MKTISNNQTYRLKLSSIIKIHFVVFIAQFESATFFLLNSDSYDRRVIDFSQMINEYVNIDAFFYEIERLLNKRIIKNKSYYLMKWKNFDNEHNVWYFIDNLQNAADFITKYEIIAFRRFIRKKIRLSIFIVRVSQRQIATITLSVITTVKTSTRKQNIQI